MNKQIKVPFLEDSITLLEAKNRPWVLVEEICSRLGVNGLQQWRRLRRHAALSALELLEVPDCHVLPVALALEDLSWFLRTLRPKAEASKGKLAEYKASLAGCLLWHGTNMSAVTAASAPCATACSLRGSIGHRRRHFPPGACR